MNNITVKNLNRIFGNFTAVNNISFEVKRGEIFGFLGPNGAGKSTTIRMLCGILKPTSGEAVVEGIDLLKSPSKVKHIIGYMSQKFSLYNDLTVLQNIEFYAGLHNITPKKFQQKANAILSKPGFKSMANNKTKTLSGGWKQYLALECAKIHDPKILFLDEPTAGVDPDTRKEFWNYIYNFSNEGKTVFVTTHYMNEAEYCDRIALMYNAQIIEIGTPNELKRNFSGHHLYELKYEENITALKNLRQKEFIIDSYHYGDLIHVVLKKGLFEKESLKQKIQIEGNPLFKFLEISPTMEDVFINSVKKKEQEINE